jgi:hypothetical protein
MIYVDDMRASYARMRMCHMVADTPEELDAMADRIGVARRWKQDAGTHREHYDICLAKRKLAVAAGAQEISMRELGRMIRARSKRLGTPRVRTCPNEGLGVTFGSGSE